MLESKLKNLKLGLAGAVLAFGVSGCSGIKAWYFQPRSPREAYPCDDDNMRHMYCDGEYIYPAVVVEVK